MWHGDNKMAHPIEKSKLNVILGTTLNFFFYHTVMTCYNYPIKAQENQKHVFTLIS